MRKRDGGNVRDLFPRGEVERFEWVGGEVKGWAAMELEVRLD